MIFAPTNATYISPLAVPTPTTAVVFPRLNFTASVPPGAGITCCGTAEMREALTHDVSHLKRFADALIAARPDLRPETLYWRLHFCLGMVHNNRFAEFDRLHALSGGATREGDIEGLLTRMLDFAEAGVLA